MILSEEEIDVGTGNTLSVRSGSVIEEDEVWNVVDNPKKTKCCTQTLSELDVVPLPPINANTSGKELIDGCQTHACERDISKELKAKQAKFAVEQRCLGPIHTESSDQHTRELTSGQLSNIDKGHDDQKKGAGVLSKCSQTEKDNDVQQSTHGTQNQSRNSHISHDLLGQGG